MQSPLPAQSETSVAPGPAKAPVKDNLAAEFSAETDKTLQPAGVAPQSKRNDSAQQSVETHAHDKAITNETAPMVSDSSVGVANTDERVEENPAQAETQNKERPMIRRALPIEDSTSVLGSNWRDQVIAKAVGAENVDDAETTETRKSSETDAAGEASDKPASGLKILLAEDNAINALLTRTFLEVEGAEVDTVEDGALAYEAVQRKDYDLIFMDMRMPNMDGLEATRKIRSYGFNKPIIALTANAFDDDRNACFDSGMNDFMTKPVSAEELSEMVATWTKETQKRLAS